jgi:hypothetical protein
MEEYKAAQAMDVHYWAETCEGLHPWTFAEQNPFLFVTKYCHFKGH